MEIRVYGLHFMVKLIYITKRNLIIKSHPVIKVTNDHKRSLEVTRSQSYSPNTVLTRRL